MAAAGLTPEKDNDGAGQMIRFAQGLLADVETFNEKSPVKLQIGKGHDENLLLVINPSAWRIIHKQNIFYSRRPWLYTWQRQPF